MSRLAIGGRTNRDSMLLTQQTKVDKLIVDDIDVAEEIAKLKADVAQGGGGGGGMTAAQQQQLDAAALAASNADAKATQNEAGITALVNGTISTTNPHTWGNGGSITPSDMRRLLWEGGNLSPAFPLIMPGDSTQTGTYGMWTNMGFNMMKVYGPYLSPNHTIIGSLYGPAGVGIVDANGQHNSAANLAAGTSAASTDRLTLLESGGSIRDPTNASNHIVVQAKAPLKATVDATSTPLVYAHGGVIPGTGLRIVTDGTIEMSPPVAPTVNNAGVKGGVFPGEGLKLDGQVGDPYGGVSPEASGGLAIDFANPVVGFTNAIALGDGMTRSAPRNNGNHTYSPAFDTTSGHPVAIGPKLGLGLTFADPVLPGAREITLAVPSTSVRGGVYPGSGLTLIPDTNGNTDGKLGLDYATILGQGLTVNTAGTQIMADLAHGLEFDTNNHIRVNLLKTVVNGAPTNTSGLKFTLDAAGLLYGLELDTVGLNKLSTTGASVGDALLYTSSGWAPGAAGGLPTPTAALDNRPLVADPNTAAQPFKYSNAVTVQRIDGAGTAVNGGSLDFYLKGPTYNTTPTKQFTFRNLNGNTQMVGESNLFWFLNNQGWGVTCDGSAVYCSTPMGYGLVTTHVGSQSDDRLKFNETSMTYDRATSLLGLVPILEYEKVLTLMTAEEEATFESGGDGFASRKAAEPSEVHAKYKPVHEAGTIAQRLEGTDAEFMVTVGNDEAPYSVKYEQLTCINTRVLQGLLDKVDALTARVAALEG